jgi:hypothetical protein
VVAYVIKNLGGGPGEPLTCLHGERERYVKLLLRMQWDPAGIERENIQRKFGIKLADPREIFMPKLEVLKKQRLVLQQAEMQVALQSFMKTQFEPWVREQSKQAAALESLYREFKNEDTLDIVCRLKDDAPVNRWLAVQIAQERWEKVDSFLVELLEDPMPLVRQAAHEALVKLSRGNDFGPFAANPTSSQIRAAQKHWRSYLETQER